MVALFVSTKLLSADQEEAVAVDLAAVEVVVMAAAEAEVAMGEVDTVATVMVAIKEAVVVRMAEATKEVSPKPPSIS